MLSCRWRSWRSCPRAPWRRALRRASRGLGGFPFKPTLDALDAALNDAGGIGGPLLRLAGLALAFGALGRLALQRFA